MKNETMMAVFPSVLARVICNHCRSCDKDEEYRKTPMKCRAFKRLLQEIKYRNDNETSKASLKKYDSNQRIDTRMPVPHP